MCTYNQHGRPHHLGDTLSEFSRGARFAQTPRKPPGLRMRWSGHRCAPLGINAEQIREFISAKFYRETITGFFIRLPDLQ